MKIKSILAALLLMVSANMMAEKYLTITYSGSEQNISLPIVQKITFEEGYVVVTTAEGKHSYPISVLDKMTFTESEDAIKALPEQAENLTYKDGTLSIKGDGMLRIYNTSGALISIANVKEGANISLDNLPVGVYIVHMGNKTIKVRK
jgi:uncharacterized paraquat-inducible protein A